MPPRPVPAALGVEKQLTAVRLLSGQLKVFSETKLYSGQINITFGGEDNGTTDLGPAEIEKIASLT